MKRKIININEEKCNGCGECIPNCPEGALQIIDGKARLVSDLFCDGLGACLGKCPLDAIKIEEREAEPYDERRVMKNIVKKGPNTIKAHLKHLKDHDEMEFLKTAITYLNENNIPVPHLGESSCASGGCPGSQERTIKPKEKVEKSQSQPSGVKSQLQQWPTQLHLMNPNAAYFKNADLLIAADCTAFAYGNFHEKFIKGRILVNLCPKLDNGINVYIDKLAKIIKENNLNSITIVRMEVPCCGGIETIVEKAMQKAGKFQMVDRKIITIDGKIK